MRILLTVHQFLPEFSAGTEVLALELSRELIRRGHDMRIFTGFPAPPEVWPDDKRFDRYQFENLRVDRFSHAYVPMGGEKNVARLEFDNPLVARYFEKIIDDFQPDVVHAYHLARLSTAPIEVCQRRNIPVIFTATDFWFICPLSQLLLSDGRICDGPRCTAGNCIKHLAIVEKTTLFRKTIAASPDWLIGAAASLVQKKLFPPTPNNNHVRAVIDRPEFIRRRFQLLDQIIVPSQTMKKIFIQHGYAEDRLLHLPYGIDTRHITRAVRKCTGEKLRVAFIGTLAPHKGPRVLIEAVRQSPATNIAVEIYGASPPGSNYPQELRAAAGDDARIKFMGTFAHERIDQVLAGIDVLVVPSVWHENTPVIIQEAQAAGCAVVASKLGGMAELVRDGVDGLLFDAGDARQLAGHLAQCAADPLFAARLAENARPPAALVDQTDKLEMLYRKTIAEHSSQA